VRGGSPEYENDAVLEGPKLTEQQVFDRVRGAFQTYDSSGPSVRHRTAIVLEQRPPVLILDGETPAFLVWMVTADSREGNAWDLRGFSTGEAAEAAAIEWLGSDRRVAWDQVSPSVLTVMMSQIQRVAWR
jgi:hypothetical protein